MQQLHLFTVQRIEAQGWLFKQSGATHLAFFASNARLFATSSRHGQVRCLSLPAGASALHAVMMPCYVLPLHMSASLSTRQLSLAGLPLCTLLAGEGRDAER